MLTTETLARSVIAVPPLARRADYSVDPEANRAIVRHIEAGGVSTLLYGGNANFYHIQLDEYAATLAMLVDIASPGSVVIPSAGPSYGMMMAQARMLRAFDFPSVMALPTRDAVTSAGIATGLRKFADALGKPIVLYIKNEGGISPDDSARLVNDGVVAAVKYAIVREDPSDDGYLEALLDLVDPRLVISGMGEQPAIIHMRDFNLAGFTSGCVCVAPRLSQDMLEAIQAGDFDRAENIRSLFEPLEDLRNEISPVRVLHEAVRLAGLAETGPLLPFFTNLEEVHHERVQEAATRISNFEFRASNIDG